MQNLLTNHSLQRAHIAAQQGNWLLLNQYMQQLLYNLQIYSAVARAANPAIEAEAAAGMVEQWEAELDQILLFILEMLAEGDFQNRWEAAKLVPQLGNRAIAPLIDLLQDEEVDLDLRWFAARILGEFNHSDVLVALVELLKCSKDNELSKMAATALAELGTVAIAPLTELLEHEHTRLSAAKVLSQIRRAETMTPLLQIADDAQAQVREVAIEALSSFHDPRIPPVLIAALSDPAPRVRQAAVTGLGMRPDLLTDLDLVNLICPLLLDLNLEVCRQSALALGRLGTEAAAVALFQILRSPHTPAPLQIDIVRALGWMEIPTASDYLQDILAGEGCSSMHVGPHVYASLQVCQEIVTVLGRTQQSALRQAASVCLIDLLQSNHPGLQDTRFKLALILALGQLQNQAALEPLMQLLADPDMRVRLHTIAALKQLDPHLACQNLETLMQQATLSPDLRQGIAIALQEWYKIP